MPIEFTEEQTRAQVEAFKRIVSKRFGVESDDLDAELAVKALADSLGVDAYNRGVADAQAYLTLKLADLGIDVYAEPDQLADGPGRVKRKPG